MTEREKDGEDDLHPEKKEDCLVRDKESTERRQPSKMDTKLQTLPLLKRFRLMQQQQEEEKTVFDSFNLPSKKRKEARNLNPPQPTPTVYLPAKKRIWALHPDLIENPLTEIDLNVKYKPPIETSPNKTNSKSARKSYSKSPRKSNSQINSALICEKIVARDDDNYDDDGIVSAVSDSTDGDPSDPIVFCDGCDLMVHSSCYGSPLTELVPDGDWFCAQCLFNKGGIFNCSMWPNTCGTMKTTKDGKWAHIMCALLVPEVFFVDSKGREGIDCSKVPKRRYEKYYYVCESSNGCAIDCSEPNCELSFHVSCGFGDDLCIEYQDGGKKRGVVVAAFCKEHTLLWEKAAANWKLQDCD